MDPKVPHPFRVRLKRFKALPRIALGLFIITQALFLPIANVLEFLPRLRTILEDKSWARQWAPEWVDNQGSLNEFLNEADSRSQRWQELTGQPQRWSLFAPEVADDIWFVGVRINQDELGSSGNEALKEPKGYSFSFLSDNEPADPNRFFRFGRFRIRRYEMAIEVHLFDYSSKTPAEQAESWRDKIRERVRKDWDNIEAYLRYRLQCFKRLHPELPEPNELVLTSRHFVIPPPEQGPFRWGEPEEVPIARWRPAEPPSGETIPIERYDPVTQRFVQVYR